MTETEEKLLEALVARGSACAGSLAKLTGIKRPTVYAALSSLCSLGIVTVHETRGAQQYRPIPQPALKQRLLEEAQRHFEKATASADRLALRLSAIQQRAPHHIAGYEIKTHESRMAVREVLEEKFSSGRFCAIFNPQIVLHAEIAKLVERCLRAHAVSKPPIRELCVDGLAAKQYINNIRNPNHRVKLLRPKVALSTDMVFKDGAVTLMHYNLDQEFAVQILHRDLYDSMMALFDELWLNASDPE